MKAIDDKATTHKFKQSNVVDMLAIAIYVGMSQQIVHLGRQSSAFGHIQIRVKSLDNNQVKLFRQPLISGPIL